jgi:hypothetical protein
MDLATIRAQLPAMTRAALGEPFDIYPMQEGKMGPAVADTSRLLLEGVMGRFDQAPEIEQIGGGRDVPERSRGLSPHASVSFAVSALEWLPKSGDQVTRLDSSRALVMRYRIDRVLEPSPGVVLCHLSRLS